MASNILKNNSFGGPTNFDRRWTTCLGGWAVDMRAELGWPSSRGKGWPPPSVTVAHVYVVLRYLSSHICASKFMSLYVIL